jgi:serine/threonine protein kinase
VSRDDLQRAARDVLRSGYRHKADLLRVKVGDACLLVKDYRSKPRAWRWLGRLQIHRELRAYRWLGALPGIPRLAGRVDADALALEWIDGELLATAPDRVSNGSRHVERLQDVVAGLHACGLAHLDLRSNKNVMLRADGEIVVCDFASALCFRPGSLAHRWIFPMARANDLSGLVKWKRTLEAGPLTARERSLLRRHGRWRRLWPFNRK